MTTLFAACGGEDPGDETGEDDGDSGGSGGELTIDVPTTGGAPTGGSSTGGSLSGGSSSGGGATGGKSSGDGGASGGTGGSEDERPPLVPVPEPEGWLEAAPDCPSGGLGSRIFQSVIVVDDITEEIEIPGATGLSSGGGLFRSSGVELEWESLVAFGETVPVSYGTYSFPSTSVHAQTYPGALCVSAGYSGYTGDGVFKFNILGLNSAEDCAGEEIAANILGCWD